MTSHTHSGISATRMHDWLIIAFGGEIGPDTMAAVRQTTLDDVQRLQIHAVVFEMSALRLLDRHEFDELRATANMASMLGAQAHFAGLRPGIIMHLVQTSDDLRGLRTHLDLADALDELGRQAAQTDHA